MRASDIGKPNRSRMEEKLDLLPSTQKVSARWDVDENIGIMCCTKCGGDVLLRYLNGTFHYSQFRSPYCPHCGEKMENGETVVD